MAFRMLRSPDQSQARNRWVEVTSLEVPLLGRLNREQVYAGGLIGELHLQVCKPPDTAALLGNCMDASSATWARYRNDQIRFSAATVHVQFPGNEPAWFDRLSDVFANLRVRRGLRDRLLVDIAMPESRSNNRHEDNAEGREEHKESEAAEGNLPQRIALQPTLLHRLGMERIRRLCHRTARCYLGLSRCTILTRYAARRRCLPTSSAIMTERCCPPVQPKAIVR